MSFTFTNAPADSDRDAVRIMLNDTSESGALLSDETVDWLIAEHPNVYLAAAAGAETIAVDSYSQPTNKKVGDLSLGRSADYLKYRQLAKSLRLRATRRVAPSAGGISVAAKTVAYADSDMVSPKFKTDQFSNPPGSTG